MNSGVCQNGSRSYFRAMAWLHTSAASLFGRQCSVYIGANSMIRVTVLHTLLLISLSHRMPEQEGSNIANALMGESGSTLLVKALSIWVIAPSLALMFR